MNSQYMKDRDLAYARWKGLKDANDVDNKSKFIVPLILSQVDSARAKLTNIFLTPEPIFEVVSPPELQAVANQYTSIYEADSQHFGWKSELSVAFLDGLKYNQLAVEVNWDVETVRATTSLADLTNDPTAPVPETDVLWAGNKLKRISLYNCFYDTSVRVKDIHKEGDFAGYTELYTATRLTRLMDKLEIQESERDEIFKAGLANAAFKYRTPDIADANTNVVTPILAAAYFDLTPDEMSKKGTQRLASYEVTKVYFRAIPADLGFTASSAEIANVNQQAIFELYIVNGCKVMSLKQLSNKHNYLPIVFCQLLDEGIGQQAKSFSHNLEDLQDVASMLITSEIKSLRRMLTDRAIYNPHLINKRDVNSPNPTAKIPLRTSAYGQSLQDAYYPIPYEDRALGSRVSQASNILSFGNDISGLNQVAAGQFVKGNKTNDQFSESMAASGQRLMALAMNLEDSFFLPLKEITRSNILQYQSPDKILSQILKQQVTISPEQLKSLIPSFKISDGLLPPDRIANSELIITAIQTIGSSPELASTYDVAGMTVHLLQVKGLRDLDKFKFTPEQAQARQAQQAQIQQQGQVNGTGQ
jgi:hypothetical protein